MMPGEAFSHPPLTTLGGVRLFRSLIKLELNVAPHVAILRSSYARHLPIQWAILVTALSTVISAGTELPYEVKRELKRGRKGALPHTRPCLLESSWDYNPARHTF